MRTVREPFKIIRANLGAYLLMNALMYGLLFIGMAAALLFPELNAAQLAAQQDNGTTDLVGRLLANPWLFALTIFAVNVGTVAVATILLPSMIVPFVGIGAFTYHAFYFGVTLAPVNATVAKVLIPHSVTILIELQAYVLVALGAYLLGKAWLCPKTVDAGNRRRGYAHGLRRIGWLSLPALVLFVIGALYEAFSLIYIVPLLVAG